MKAIPLYLMGAVFLAAMAVVIYAGAGDTLNLNLEVCIYLMLALLPVGLLGLLVSLHGPLIPLVLCLSLGQFAILIAAPWGVLLVPRLWPATRYFCAVGVYLGLCHGSNHYLLRTFLAPLAKIDFPTAKAIAG